MTSHLLSGVMFVLASSLVAQSDEFRTDFTRHTVDLSEIVSGGPPKDGIPSIDEPHFVPVEHADVWLGEREPVAVIRLHGIVRVYPLQILMWHEIVNDVIGMTPVTVTFCPLCNTTLAFDRRFDNQVLSFGTTGRLRHSDLIMYDRQTETWWQQATGEGIVGEYAGERLTYIPAPVMYWGAVRDAEPGAEVLSRQTGHTRQYGRNPYRGYDRGRGPLRRFFRADHDDRLSRMERVVAIDTPGDPVAVPFSDLEDVRVVNVETGGKNLVVFWLPGTASALDAVAIRDGRDVGASGVFERETNGRMLTFAPTDNGQFRDHETGSLWNLLGQAVDGPLAGTQLTEVTHGNHFWFAWGVFRPETRIIRK